MKETYVCPASLSGSLDNIFRRWLHKPDKILGPYIQNGMTVLDLGCGPGYFTAELARLAGEEGKVIAADLQPEMLEKMQRKISETGLEKRITAHLCQSDRIGLDLKVDFILAFWMVHEVPDQPRLFKELKSILKTDGKVFIIEPKFHVRKRSFSEMIGHLESAGFKIIEWPDVPISHSILMTSL